MLWDCYGGQQVDLVRILVTTQTGFFSAIVSAVGNVSILSAGESQVKSGVTSLCKTRGIR